MIKHFFRGLILSSSLFSITLAWAAAAPRQQVTYMVSVNGLQLASIQGELTKQNSKYQLTVSTSLDIPQLALSGFSQSKGQFVNDYPKPQRYIENSQFTDQNFQRDLTFNWEKSIVSTSQTDKPLSIPADTQDMLSCYLAIQYDLEQKRSPLSCNITDGKGVKKYTFSQHGTETLQTIFGPVEAVVIQHQHKKRQVRFWLAPKYDYLVVQAEYLFNDQWDVTAKLSSYQ